MPDALNILVLAGGPDRERQVSLQSGATVAAALREAGHEVVERDISPSDLSALEEFVRWPGDAVFPALHGGWGEGGGLQAILDERRIPYVGCRAPAAALCMDKYDTKAKLFDTDLPTLPFELVRRGQSPTIQPPLVIKPRREGSSIGMAICHDAAEVAPALRRLHEQFDELLVEKFCAGFEMTVGVLESPHDRARPHALPPIRIVPAAAFYDYDAKYARDDTRYWFDPQKIGLEMRELEGLGVLAVEVFTELGCRHMARVDFIVDEHRRPWILEVNTIPGFTSHSLLPMAAKEAGIPLPQLVDRLVRMAAADG